MQAGDLDRSVDLFDDLPIQPYLVKPSDPDGPVQLEDPGDEIFKCLPGSQSGVLRATI
jgi:hypothetical protein